MLVRQIYRYVDVLNYLILLNKETEYNLPVFIFKFKNKFSLYICAVLLWKQSMVDQCSSDDIDTDVNLACLLFKVHFFYLLHLEKDVYRTVIGTDFIFWIFKFPLCCVRCIVSTNLFLARVCCNSAYID